MAHLFERLRRGRGPACVRAADDDDAVLPAGLEEDNCSSCRFGNLAEEAKVNAATTERGPEHRPVAVSAHLEEQQPR